MRQAATFSSALARFRGLALACCLCAAMLGCAERLTSCYSDLRVHITPQQIEIGLGKSFLPRAAAYTCGGSKRMESAFAFSTVDSAVVSIDEVTGRVYGIGVGVGRIRVTEPDLFVDFDLIVTVVP